MNRDQLNYAKLFIKDGRFRTIQTYLKEYQQNRQELGYHNDPYIFQQLFSHACSCNQLQIAQWLYQEIFLKFDFGGQSGIRHTFNYCKVVADPKKQRKLKQWLTQIVIDNQIKFNVNI